MTKEKLIFWFLYKMFNIIKSITQLPYQIIKYISLLSLKTIDFLANNKFILLLSNISC